MDQAMNQAMASGASGRASSTTSELQRATLEAWLNAQTSQNTRSAYRSDLESFGSWCAREGAIPLTATTEAIVAFQVARETAGDSPATIRRRWSALSSFYDYALQRDLVPANPVVGVNRPKVEAGDPSLTVQLTHEAVATCRAVAAALDPRLEALVALVVSDGLKVNEALALDIGDVSGRPRATSITVRRRGAVHTVLLEHASGLAVRRCVGSRRSGPVFVSERSSQSTTPSRLTRFGADHLIRQLRTDDATEQVTANALRRFHISTREASGLALEDVRDGAGLSDVRGVRRFVGRS